MDGQINSKIYDFSYVSRM